jgi:hypothetical protein
MRATQTRTVAAASLVVALLCPLTTAQAATPVDVQWSTPRFLSDAGQNALSPTAAVSDDASAITVVWKRYVGTSDMVQTATSPDGGNTWQSVKTISTPGRPANSPTIGASADGMRLVSAWTSYDGADYRLRSSTSSDGGTTWSEPVDVSQAGQDAVMPVLAVSSDAMRVTALWRRSDGTHRRIETASSQDGGGNWSTPRTLSEAGQHAEAPAIASSADGNRVAAAWTRYDGSRYRLQAAYSPNGGAAWSLPLTVSDVGEEANWPTVTSSADGARLAIAWRGFDGLLDRARTVSSADGGLTWSSPVTISAGQSSYDPTIAASSDGTRLVAAWSGSEGSFYRIRAASSSDAGQTWSAPVTLSADGQDGQGPLVSASRDGQRVTAVWKRSDGT